MTCFWLPMLLLGGDVLSILLIADMAASTSSPLVCNAGDTAIPVALNEISYCVTVVRDATGSAVICPLHALRAQSSALVEASGHSFGSLDTSYCR